MTIDSERTNAINAVRRFLLDLTSAKETPRVPLKIRKAAFLLLKHYPTQSDVKHRLWWWR